MTVPIPSDSKRPKLANSTGSSPTTSSTTAPNTTSGGTPRATRVADPPQRGLLGQQAREFVPALLQRALVLRVRDGGGDQVGELRHALLGVGRQRTLSGSDGDHPPQPAVDVDRHRDRRTQSFAQIRLSAGKGAVVVHARGPAGTQDGGGQPGFGIALPRSAETHVRTGRAVVRDERRRSVELEPDHPGGAAAETPQHLAGRGREHRLGRFAPGDQRGQPPQRGLGVRQLALSLVGFGTGDRGGGEFHELRHVRLGARGEVRPGREGQRHTPAAAADHDGRGDRAVHAQRAGPLSERAVGQPFAAPPSRAPGTQRGGLHHLGQQLELEADRNPRAQRAVGPLHGDDGFEFSILVGRMVDTRDEGRLGADEMAELVRDRGEHLRRLRAAGDQCRHAPQRGLLIHELTQPCPFGRVMARRGVGGTLRVYAEVRRVHGATLSR